MADEEKMEGEQAEDGAEGSSGGGKKKLIIIALVVLLLVGAGVPAALMLGGGGSEEVDEHGEEHVEEVVKHYETVELDVFIVNLSKASAFLKVQLMLEYDPELLHGGHGGHGGGGGYGGGASGGGGGDEGGLPGAFAEREPMIRDAVIHILSAKTPEQVLTPDGKEELKEELIEAINDALNLEEGPVVNIYFKQFIIQ